MSNQPTNADLNRAIGVMDDALSAISCEYANRLAGTWAMPEDAVEDFLAAMHGLHATIHHLASLVE